MLFVSSESQLILHALDGEPGERLDVAFNEFDGLAGRLTMDKLAFTLTLCHPIVAGCMDCCKQSGQYMHQRFTLEEHAADIAKLRRNIVAAPLEAAMDNQGDGRPTATQKVLLNDQTGEALWVFGKEDRVAVILALVIKDATERTFADTFLKELVDTRSLPDHQSAPSVCINDGLPPDLVGEDPIPNAVFVTFVLFPRNYEPLKREKTVDRVIFFRESFFAHLRAAKMYLHSRMRIRTAEMEAALSSMRKKKGHSALKTFRYNSRLLRHLQWTDVCPQQLNSKPTRLPRQPSRHWWLHVVEWHL